MRTERGLAGRFHLLGCLESPGRPRVHPAAPTARSGWVGRADGWREGEPMGTSCLLRGRSLSCGPCSRLPGTEASDAGMCPKRVGDSAWRPPHSPLPEAEVGQGSRESRPRGFGGEWGGQLGQGLPQLPPRSRPGSAAPCLPTAVPSWAWPLEVPVRPGLGPGPRQLCSRGWRSAEVAVVRYIRNCMEMTVSSSSTPRLPTSQGRWCSR